MTETNGQECPCPPVGHCWDCPVPREQGRQAKLDAITREHLDDRYLDMTCMRCGGKPIVAGTGHCETCIGPPHPERDTHPSAAGGAQARGERRGNTPGVPVVTAQQMQDAMAASTLGGSSRTMGALLDASIARCPEGWETWLAIKGDEHDDARRLAS